MRCPECKSEIGTSKYCGCGWGESAKPVDANRTLGYQQCEWNSDGERCRYPGSISSSIGASGPWYCRMHFDCRNPVFGAEVVKASRDYKHETNREKDAKARTEAEEFCRKLGLDTPGKRTKWIRGMAERMANKRPSGREAA